jgi:hypothetical protein
MTEYFDVFRHGSVHRSSRNLYPLSTLRWRLEARASHAASVGPLGGDCAGDSMANVNKTICPLVSERAMHSRMSLDYALKF